MRRPVHFEIHVDDPARAQKFYQTLFGWTFQQYGDIGYWVINTGPDDQPGINGGMLPRQGGSGDRVVGWVCTVEVEDLDAALETVEANGGAVAMPKDDMGGIGWVAYAFDSERNIFGMIQNKPT
jgi:predicted enzyme related to lactoylglutathione lyase